MITIKTTGTTEMADGRSLGLNHVFYVADDAVELMLAGAAKVGCRPSLKKQAGVKAGDTVIYNVVNANGKLRYAMVDERAARRAEVQQHNAAIALEIAKGVGRISNDELLALAAQMINEE